MSVNDHSPSSTVFFRNLRNPCLGRGPYQIALEENLETKFWLFIIIIMTIVVKTGYYNILVPLDRALFQTCQRFL